MNIFIANIIALMGSFLLVYSGTRKQKSKIIIIQTIQILLFVISNLLLGGFTGAIINVICIIRNVLYYKNLLKTNTKVILIILSILFTIPFNTLGFIGLLPLISNVVYILFMHLKNVVNFKLLIAFTTFLWLIYDFSIKSYTSSMFDFLSIITSFIAIYQIKHSTTKKTD